MTLKRLTGEDYIRDFSDRPTENDHDTGAFLFIIELPEADNAPGNRRSKMIEPEEWDEVKDEFLRQRIARRMANNAGFSESEIINIEKKYVEGIEKPGGDYEAIMIERYKKLLDESTSVSAEDAPTDGRVCERAPTNIQKLKALDAFAPELISSLRKVDTNTQKAIIRMITGVNAQDAYQYLLAGRRKYIDEAEVKNIENYLLKLKEGQNRPL